MRVSKIYTYPIKSFRGDELESAQVTKYGFRYDRRFMLLQVIEKEDGTMQELKNMQVSKYNEMVLFFTKIQFPSSTSSRDGSIIVTHRPPQEEESSIEVPLEPETSSLDQIEVSMYGSSTKAYRMDHRYNAWLSDRFGFKVILAYLGDGLRPILMSTGDGTDHKSEKSWFSTVTSITGALTGSATPEERSKQITFADCGPFLVASERSMDDVHNRLTDGQKMDISKFRPNIIISGADDVWEEDYWAEIKINDEVTIECIHNCNRCKSINIDYATGKQGTEEAGKMLSKLQKDRRIDTGSKYSPVFGRYSFLGPNSEGKTITIGDEVVVVRRNDTHTVFGKSSLPALFNLADVLMVDWPGLATK